VQARWVVGDPLERILTQEPSQFRVVEPGLEVVQTGGGVALLAREAEGVEGGAGLCGYDAPGVVPVPGGDAAVSVGEVGDGAQGVEVVEGSSLGGVVQGDEAVGAVVVFGYRVAEVVGLEEDALVVVEVAEDLAAAGLADAQALVVEAVGALEEAVFLDF
jgi:hypothetical protein